MGTITRTFANNITTSGIFKPTAFNNASFDNVTSVPEGAVEGGSMVLLSTQTASASSSISFTSGITSSYKEYMFIYNNLHPSVDGVRLNFNFSTDAGSNWNVTKTTSCHRAVNSESPGFYGLGASGLDVAQSTSDAPLLDAVGADNDQSASGFLYLYNPSDTTYVKHLIARSSSVRNDDLAFDVRVAGYGNTTSAIDGVIFRFASGNIDAGTIQMFGIL